MQPSPAFVNAAREFKAPNVAKRGHPPKRKCLGLLRKNRWILSL
jgi:hypothetical protein